MRSLVTIFAVVFGSFTVSATAMATVGDDLKAAKGDLLVVSKVICASGKVNQSQAKAIIGQKTNSWFVADVENYGGVLQKSGDTIAEVLAVNGKSDGFCDNKGQPTILIEIFEKAN